MIESNGPSDRSTETPPFLKWAGGKRWLVHRIRKLVPAIESVSGTYFEPILGTGAMFFSLRPAKVVLNDLNTELINGYRYIKNDPDALNRLLRRYERHHYSELYHRPTSLLPGT